MSHIVSSLISMCKTFAFKNDAEWEAELEGELNEYEMVGNFKAYGQVQCSENIFSRLAEMMERS